MGTVEGCGDALEGICSDVEWRTWGVLDLSRRLGVLACGRARSR
jgi:hypothetical protein